MKATTARATDVGRRGGLERRHYLIGHFRVSFQSGSAWHCPCIEFAMANACRHTREAAGMREAQARILEQVGARHQRLDRSMLRTD